MTTRGAADVLQEARVLERSGQLEEAVACYTGAIALAEASGEGPVLAEALRRLAVVHHHRNEAAASRSLCQRSHAVATTLGHDMLVAEALNVLAGFDLELGDLEAARANYDRALARGGTDPTLRGRILQNLGILANVRGDWTGAREHYVRSLSAFACVGDDKGCAIAWHNLGMICADQGLWDEADGHYAKSLEAARRLRDVHLEALCLLNRSEVFVARQRYEDARESAEAALRIFDQLGARLDKADAYKVIGVVYRETGRTALAESRLRNAIEFAAENGSVLSQAEASREMAILYQGMGRNQDALRLLNTAYRLFGRLDARVDLVDVDSKVVALESTFLAVVREWGQSIESADSYTHGHCERVANLALTVARQMGLADDELTTIRLGAYLHDVGKVRVPHEILNKPGSLTPEEFEVITRHPLWGLELLAAVEFPWDIKPIIRWHHEKHDGSGYPDRLRGDEIPVNAVIIGIVDVYDALTTTRSYRAAMSHDEALAQMRKCRHWWRADVYEAFMASVGLGGEAERAAA